MEEGSIPSVAAGDLSRVLTFMRITAIVAANVIGR